MTKNISLTQNNPSSKPDVHIGQATPTPLGSIWVAVSQQGLIAIKMQGGMAAITKTVERLGFTTAANNATRTSSAVHQLIEYLAGKRRSFEIPIDWSLMTSFQKKVLRATLAIPYGETRAYGEIAEQIGKPQAARAVGRAQATNPMPLVIPCHRVIGADGSLIGYGGTGGLKTKAWLLDLEKSNRVTSAMG